jgi:hypothetical protein
VKQGSPSRLPGDRAERTPRAQGNDTASGETGGTVPRPELQPTAKESALKAGQPATKQATATACAPAGTPGPAGPHLAR